MVVVVVVEEEEEDAGGERRRKTAEHRAEERRAEDGEESCGKSFFRCGLNNNFLIIRKSTIGVTNVLLSSDRVVRTEIVDMSTHLPHKNN